MNFIDGFRRMEAAQHFRTTLADHGALLAKEGRSVQLMEVCGSHTMAIARFGIRAFLPPNVTLVSGPGCPVCVTDPGYIDTAIALAEQGTLILTFGDMARVPGSRTTLEATRAAGGRIEICYSPQTALEQAQTHPDTAVVFLAVGFETTVAPIMAMLDHAIRSGIGNLSLLTAFKRIPPALEALITDPGVKIDGLLCPAHVSAIIGADAYRPYAETHGVACVVAGFEPLDILYGLHGLTRQLVDHHPWVENQYNRVVKPEGNRQAQRIIERYLEPCDASWRGLGEIPASGLQLRHAFTRYDAHHRFGMTPRTGRPNPRCQCGEVLKGKMTPSQCPLFGNPCHPDHPLGPCMVSSEGSCAAGFKYAPGGETP
ncbi:MAG: hydrogenase formation protein HypD [Magnetococcales bacterium]|nr:hydrogenase formation protein HypD [Magnetococcales bacterium]MBF0151384.1 hydrogenase formation protein HypD [Magnetococcales bacterium]MBF0174350.1 hydrogenase formation protein HypD [Magnetococcales bacterium]MBF0348319.1 hydrogenase formation protein HypD [Magnetococcales bacterium]MBF0631560.1 hydrogenase formation protein HypD [Magnetococcales bacterium]